MTARSMRGASDDRSGRRAELVRGLASVRSRIADACAEAGRSVDDVRLVVVTKFFPAQDAADLVRIGCRDLGESRSQEAAAKVARCAGILPAGGEAARQRPPRWHMLGRVQRNKARAVARWADAVHSVDSPRLADALANAAARALDAHERSAPLRVYVQVTLDGDPARGGAAPEDVRALADVVAGAEALELAGVMAVAPLGGPAESVFERLATIHEGVLTDHPAATGLSAGMSGDLEAAIAHGSTCVRVGTAVMGARPILSP